MSYLRKIYTCLVSLKDWLIKLAFLIGLLKYGIVLSLLMVYLPLTAMFARAPGHDITGNMFVELSMGETFVATLFLLAVTWSIMVTEGLIVNGSESWFFELQPVDLDQPQGKKLWRRGPAYRTLQEIKDRPSPYLHKWAELLFCVPVTCLQFLLFTILLAGPSLGVIVWDADSPSAAIVAVTVAFIIDYVALIVICAPIALLNHEDPPLHKLPLAGTIWSWFGYQPDAPSLHTLSYRLSRRVQQCISTLASRLGCAYLLDPKGCIYPAHFLAILIVIALLVFWNVFALVANPEGTIDLQSVGLQPPSVVYVYASLLLFVWLLAGLNFHLGRLHFSPIVVLLAFIIIGYSIFDIDHEYKVTREESPPPLPTPVEVVQKSKGGKNLVVVTSEGGGIWAAGWTALALEKLIGARTELAHEIRLLSTVSGGSVGAAQYVWGLLNDPQYREGKELSPNTLRNIRVKATSSSLEAAAYGVAFRDFPRLVTGGLYYPIIQDHDRGELLEDEWARTAAGTVKESPTEKETEYRVHKGAKGTELRLLDLGAQITTGLIPAVIFNATVMESGQKVMITPVDFRANGVGYKRGQTLAEFLFPDPKSGVAPAGANLPFWTAARLSATFSFVSPAVRTNVANKKAGEQRNQWRQHLVDGGYYDNFGVASALDWLQPVLEARRDGKEGLNFSRVLIIQLRGFADKQPEQAPSSFGAEAALIGPLDALFAIREGVASSRNSIDVARFINSWNRQLEGKAQLQTVEFAPADTQPKGPLSWHLCKADINNLEKSWNDSKNIKDNLDQLKNFLD